MSAKRWELSVSVPADVSPLEVVHLLNTAAPSEIAAADHTKKSDTQATSYVVYAAVTSEATQQRLARTGLVHGASRLHVFASFAGAHATKIELQGIPLLATDGDVTKALTTSAGDQVERLTRCLIHDTLIANKSAVAWLRTTRPIPRSVRILGVDVAITRLAHRPATNTPPTSQAPATATGATPPPAPTMAAIAAAPPPAPSAATTAVSTDATTDQQLDPEQPTEPTPAPQTSNNKPKKPSKNTKKTLDKKDPTPPPTETTPPPETADVATTSSARPSTAPPTATETENVATTDPKRDSELTAETTPQAEATTATPTSVSVAEPATLTSTTKPTPEVTTATRSTPETDPDQDPAPTTPNAVIRLVTFIWSKVSPTSPDPMYSAQEASDDLPTDPDLATPVTPRYNLRSRDRTEGAQPSY